MTANEDAIDLAAIEERIRVALDEAPGWRDENMERDALLAVVYDVRALIAELRSRASIGPDSECIREAEQVLTFAFADVKKLPEWMQVPALGRDMTPLGELAVTALRAAGLLPGPDDIAVSREALAWVDDHLRRTTRTPTAEKAAVMATIAAALSQPHPAQESP
jgi:hypothetical protein